MKDEIDNIEAVDVDDSKVGINLDQLFHLNFQEADEDLAEKHKNLKEWLEKNRIPIVENNNDDCLINIMDTVFIHKPFNEENCESTNEIILNKIINLVRQFNEINKR